jgi:ribose transport system ATP-binding protein
VTSASDAQGAQPVALRVSHLSKTFPGTLALNDVTVEIHKAEIHALLGGNGSGKSTLIKVLAGVYGGDAGGRIEVGTTTAMADSWSPAAARAAGLRFVHQNPGVFLDLTVAENMAIGHGFETGLGGRIRWSEVNARTSALLDRFHIEAAPQTLVGALRPADRTMVAIARALQDQDESGEGVLVLDEPTASLPASEVDLLLEALRRYRAAGQTIIYVTHRLDEVLDIADRVTVLRDGVHVGTVTAAGLAEGDLIELIVGRALDRVFPDMPPVEGDEVVLEARDLTGGPLRGISFGLRRGEVVGIAGLLGTGRSELLRMIFGDYPIASGQLLLEGKPVQFSSPTQAMAAGIALVPEDRAADAAFLDMSVRENLSAAQIPRYWKAMRLDHRAEHRDAQQSIRDFFIKTPSDLPPLNTLSGGNQQKVIVARWLRRSPKFLLLDEPTQGVDVGARAEIYALVRKAVVGGASVIVVTSDFEELAHVVDRAIVIAGGCVVAELRPPEIDGHRLTELAYIATEVGS